VAPARGYLDTCLVSGLAKRDLRPSEHEALRQLLWLRKAGALVLVTSPVTREELQRIPPDARELHEDIYALLDDVPLAQEVQTDSGLTLTGVGGGPRENPTFTSLKAVLKDVNDARHLFQAIQNDVQYFVTDDERTVIRHASEIQDRFGLVVRLPSRLLAEL
jgi:hypothetical protein